MKVLVIPEDFVNDQWILKPVFEAMFASLGKPQAKIRVCQDPRFNGVGQALKWEQIQLVLERYEGMVDIFILCVDRDADENRRAVLDGIEQKATDHLATAHRRFLAEHAFQEVEVWALAGMKDLPKDWVWSEIRDDRDPKERYYLPYARRAECKASRGKVVRSWALRRPRTMVG